jgi:hypothetical protein
MTPKEVTEVFLSKSPEDFIKIMESAGLDSIKMENSNIALRLANSGNPEISEENTKAIDFCFWFCYIVERNIQKVIISVEEKIGSRKDSIERFLDEFHLSNKITLLTDYYLAEAKKEKRKKLKDILWKVNTLRNNIAHGKFDNLKYKGHHLSKLIGQLTIIKDYVEALKTSDASKK